MPTHRRRRLGMDAMQFDRFQRIQGIRELKARRFMAHSSFWHWRLLKTGPRVNGRG